MMPSRSSTSIADPSKLWKSLIFSSSNPKPSDFFSFFFKAFLTVCSLASISLVVYFAATTANHRNHQWPHCPACGVVADNRISEVQAQAPYPTSYPSTDLSHILFGIGGSVRTWNTRRRYSDLWWRPKSMRGFVWLDKKPPRNLTWPSTSPPYRISADTSRFNYTCWYGSRSAIRVARIVKESFELGLPNVRWFVMGDDDTVFFVDNLLTVLSKYDHNQMYYIGGISESVEQDVIHSYTMAYGGGGFAISYPLAKELVRILDGCINRYASFYGSDQKIQGCISEIGVPVTRELGFHQVDIRGNPYGLLSAHPLAPLVSLHHLDYIETIFPALDRISSVKRLMTAYKSDPNRALQHSFCYDRNRKWTISVSWGYTIQLYPFLLTAKEMEKTMLTFQTWRTWSREPFTFNTRPVSEDPCRRPLLYFLERVYEFGSGESLTTYRRHEYSNDRDCDLPHYRPALAVKFFDVFASKLKPVVWKTAPRRQCCQVLDGGEDEDGVMRVRTRNCQPFESVTP